MCKHLSFACTVLRLPFQSPQIRPTKPGTGFPQWSKQLRGKTGFLQNYKFYKKNTCLKYQIYARKFPNMSLVLEFKVNQHISEQQIGWQAKNRSGQEWHKLFSRPIITAAKVFGTCSKTTTPSAYDTFGGYNQKEGLIQSCYIPSD